MPFMRRPGAQGLVLMTYQHNLLASPIAQLVKNPPAMQETWIRFLGQENPQKKEMATHSNILAWEIPWREEPGGLQSMGSQESDVPEQLNHQHNLK